MNLSKGEITDKLHDKEALCCGVEDTIDSEIMDCGPNLKVIANYGVGYDNIDIEAATERRILVTNTPGVLTDAVAEMTWCLLLCIARRVVEADSFVRAGRYRASGPRFFLGAGIRGKTLGIIGTGRIGTAVAKKSIGFNLEILYCDLVKNQKLEKIGAKKVDLDYLLRHSDFVSLHVPLTHETAYLIGEKELTLMKKTTYLINTSRGKVVNEAALVEALEKKQIAGAALDVYENEPQITNKLLSMKNVVLTPHISSATRETRDKMSIMVAEDCIAALKGERPPHLVNTEVLG
jgi:glyoxylate reductase